MKLGRVYLTPYLRVDSIGLDTNVFYSATDRRTDVSASGGPGLELVLPAGKTRLLTSGGIHYTYFARTPSQRRLGGDGRARLEWRPGRLFAAVEERYRRRFDRPSFEVDERVLQDTWGTYGELALDLPGRLGLTTRIDSARTELPESSSYRGTDLRRTLTHDEHRLIAGLRLRLTGRTSAVVEGDHQIDRFALATGRDADSNRAYAGFQFDSQTRLRGRMVGGLRFFRPRTRDVDPLDPTLYADVNLIYPFGPRTRINLSGTRDLSFSAFDTTGPSSTLRTERAEARLEKGLFARFVVDFYGGYSRSRSNGELTLLDDAGDAVTARRDDRVRFGGIDLGYVFRSRIRVGVAATFTDRRSSFADLGIEGLLLGATVRFTP